MKPIHFTKKNFTSSTMIFFVDGKLLIFDTQQNQRDTISPDCQLLLFFFRFILKRTSSLRLNKIHSSFFFSHPDRNLLYSSSIEENKSPNNNKQNNRTHSAFFFEHDHTHILNHKKNMDGETSALEQNFRFLFSTRERKRERKRERERARFCVGAEGDPG